jgi:hypothetical protein
MYKCPPVTTAPGAVRQEYTLADEKQFSSSRGKREQHKTDHLF